MVSKAPRFPDAALVRSIKEARMIRINLTRAALFAALAASLVGCSKPRPDGLPSLVPCSVTITQDSQPLEGATVAFESDDMRWAIGGSTDANGEAKMFTHGTYPGAPEGTYKVTVVKQVVEADGSAETASSTPSAKAYNLVDAQFFKPDTTPLEITVKGKTKEAFDVGAAVREPVKML